MEISHYYKGDNLVISLVGELDECTASASRSKLDKLIVVGGYYNVIFDLSGLTFMDSTGIGVLLGRYKMIKQSGAAVMISGSNRQIDKVLQMSGIYSIMKKIS